MDSQGISSTEKIRYKNGIEDEALLVRKHANIKGQECIAYINLNGTVVVAELCDIEEICFMNYEEAVNSAV